jgi:hypothetical protein
MAACGLHSESAKSSICGGSDTRGRGIAGFRLAGGIEHVVY